MLLLEKIDAVLEALYDHSGDNPNFPLLEEWLQNKKIDKGEIRDILIKLGKEGLIYFEGGGDMNVEYSDYGHYLISFDGKMFWETEGGFKNKVANDAYENDRVKALEVYQGIQSKKLTDLTWWISIATSVAAIYYLLEILEKLYKYGKCCFS
jgi:hypothetical protein